jgi:hypothetical protein
MNRQVFSLQPGARLNLEIPLAVGVRTFSAEIALPIERKGNLELIAQVTEVASHWAASSTRYERFP